MNTWSSPSIPTCCGQMFGRCCAGPAGPSAVSAANLKDNAGTVTALTATAIQAVLSTTTFVKSGAATFIFGSGTTTRTFLALNDGTAGFSASTDAILEITGYSGSLVNLAVI
ncbi:MAG: bluetail domain-containing putative surface protein [Cyanobacteriota bacterium]